MNKKAIMLIFYLFSITNISVVSLGGDEITSLSLHTVQKSQPPEGATLFYFERLREEIKKMDPEVVFIEPFLRSPNLNYLLIQTYNLYGNRRFKYIYNLLNETLLPIEENRLLHSSTWAESFSPNGNQLVASYFHDKAGKRYEKLIWKDLTNNLSISQDLFHFGFTSFLKENEIIYITGSNPYIIKKLSIKEGKPQLPTDLYNFSVPYNEGLSAMKYNGKNIYIFTHGLKECFGKIYYLEENNKIILVTIIENLVSEISFSPDGNKCAIQTPNSTLIFDSSQTNWYLEHDLNKMDFLCWWDNQTILAMYYKNNSYTYTEKDNLNEILKDQKIGALLNISGTSAQIENIPQLFQPITP